MRWRWWRNRATAEIIFTWENHTERVGLKAAVAAVERRDHWNTHHANKVDRDKPRRRALFCPVTNTTDVMRVMQRHGGYAVLMRFLNPQRHRFVCCYLTKCAIAIERDRRPRLFNDFGMVVNLQMPLTRERT